MIVLPSGKLEDRCDVFVFQVRVVSENLLSRGAGQKVEDILDTNAEPAEHGRPPHTSGLTVIRSMALMSVPQPPASETGLYPGQKGSTIGIPDPWWLP